jgi:hypothetical protein
MSETGCSALSHKRLALRTSNIQNGARVRARSAMLSSKDQINRKSNISTATIGYGIRSLRERSPRLPRSRLTTTSSTGPLRRSRGWGKFGIRVKTDDGGLSRGQRGIGYSRCVPRGTRTAGLRSCSGDLCGGPLSHLPISLE